LFRLHLHQQDETALIRSIERPNPVTMNREFLSIDARNQSFSVPPEQMVDERWTGGGGFVTRTKTGE
jgi:hypothetical protein